MKMKLIFSHGSIKQKMDKQRQLKRLEQEEIDELKISFFHLSD